MKINSHIVSVPRGTIIDPRTDSGGGGTALKVAEWEWDYDPDATIPCEDFQLRRDDTGDILNYLNDPLIASENYLIAVYNAEPGKLRVRLLTYRGPSENVSFRVVPENQNALTNARVIENDTFSLVDGWWKGEIKAGAPALSMQLDEPIASMSEIKLSGFAEGLDSGWSFYVFVTVNNVFKATEVFIANSRDFSVTIDASTLTGAAGDSVEIKANNYDDEVIINTTWPDADSGLDYAKIEYDFNPSASTPFAGASIRNDDTGEVFGAYEIPESFGVSFGLGLNDDGTKAIIDLKNANANVKNLSVQMLPTDQNMLLNPVVTVNDSFKITGDVWVQGRLAPRDMTPFVEIVNLPSAFTSENNNTVELKIKNLTNISLEVTDQNGQVVIDRNRTISDPFQESYKFQYQRFADLTPGPITIRAYSTDGAEDTKTSTYTPG